MLSPQAGGDGTVIKLGEVVMIMNQHRQGVSVSAIALQLGIDRKTVRKYIARGLEAPVYGTRQPRPRRIDPFVPYLRERVEAWPGLTGRSSFASTPSARRTRARAHPLQGAHHPRPPVRSKRGQLHLHPCHLSSAVPPRNTVQQV
jgi:hypothetical protein